MPEPFFFRNIKIFFNAKASILLFHYKLPMVFLFAFGIEKPVKI